MHSPSLKTTRPMESNTYVPSALGQGEGGWGYTARTKVPKDSRRGPIPSLPNHRHSHRQIPWRKAGVRIAGLVTQLSIQKMGAALCHHVHLQHELAVVAA